MLGFSLLEWASFATIISGLLALIILPGEIKKRARRYLNRRTVTTNRYSIVAEAPVPAIAERSSSVPLREPLNLVEAELSAAMKIVRREYVRNRRWVRTLKQDVDRYGQQAFEDAAKRGNTDALFLLGMMATSGYNNSKDDLSQAASYIELASDLGDAEAMTWLAAVYSGEVYLRDDARALILLNKAVELKHPEAFLRLAQTYENGWHGEPKDYPRAIRLYESAIAGGSGVAMLKLGELLLTVNDKATQDRGMELIKDADREKLIDAKIELALRTMSGGLNIMWELQRLTGWIFGATLSLEGKKMMQEVLADPDSDYGHKSMAENWLKEPGNTATGSAKPESNV